MRILVISDSHGAEEKFIKAIDANPSAEAIVFLGDGERDLEYAMAHFGIFPYGDKIKDVYQVRGNCDFYSRSSDSVIAEIKDTRLFITHGYDQKVKHGLERLAFEAAKKDCVIALFGHTHTRHLSSIGGVTLFNPGSLRSGSYGIIKIKKDKIDFKWKEV